MGVGEVMVRPLAVEDHGSLSIVKPPTSSDRVEETKERRCYSRFGGYPKCEKNRVHKDEIGFGVRESCQSCGRI